MVDVHASTVLIRRLHCIGMADWALVLQLFMHKSTVPDCGGPVMAVEGYSPPEVDRIWGIWGSYSNIPKGIFYLLKGNYRCRDCDMQP